MPAFVVILLNLFEQKPLAIENAILNGSGLYRLEIHLLLIAKRDDAGQWFVSPSAQNLTLAHIEDLAEGAWICEIQKSVPTAVKNCPKYIKAETPRFFERNGRRNRELLTIDKNFYQCRSIVFQ